MKKVDKGGGRVYDAGYMEQPVEASEVASVAQSEPKAEHQGTKNLRKSHEYKRLRKAREAAEKLAFEASEKERLAREASMPVPDPSTVPGTLWQDMAFVYTMPESRDDTEGRKRCRGWLKAKPIEFLNKLESLAEEVERGKVKESKAEACEPDGGTAVAVAMLEDLLLRKPWLQEVEDGD